MKKFFIIQIFLLCTLGIFAQTQKDLKSSVKNVTIFTTGAQVVRSANVSLQPGTTELVFNGVSPYLNVSSIQASVRELLLF